MAEASSAAIEDVEDAESSVNLDEPQDYWEKEAVANQIANFKGNPATGDVISMLVAVRVRPLWDKEMEAGDYSTVRVLENKVVVVLDPWYDAVLNPNRAKEKKYAFDVVFDEKADQQFVYSQTAAGLVSGVLDGYNSSVFAYGSTGAGKTHTMLGSLDAPGVMVNTLHDMFIRMKEPSFAEAKFKVTLSYMEIYNELIKDLLNPVAIDLKLNEDPARGMVVQGITEYGADSADEILELLHRGNMHRAIEPTAANQVSSRSHAVLQITIEQSERTAHVTGNVRIGKLSMVDLAGSERASKTNNTGDRLKEGANINRSLLALGNCITALADKNRKGHVPFRDSKMTRLLKDSLGGNCRTVMIANITPSHRQFEETINTLKYANRAKNLKTQVARNVVSVSAHIAEYQRVIMELRNEVADLKSELKSGGGGSSALASAVPNAEASVGSSRKQRSLDYVDNLEKQHMQQLKDAIMGAMTERRRLLQKLTDHSRALSEARSSTDAAQAAAAADESGDKKSSDAAAQPPDAGQHAELHSAIAETRRLLQKNQQTINEIISTAVQRISSQERLQLLQLLVRGKFLEVMNEEMSTELEMRRALTQAAMQAGSLPPHLMNQAMTTESWYTEHRAALDYHAKMAKTQMGGSLHAPSIAQLLDQNLVSPQQASASQNLGDLVRPFTNNTNSKPGARSTGKLPLHDASRGSSVIKKRDGSVSPSAAALATGAASSTGAGSSSLLSNLVDDDPEEDRHSYSSSDTRSREASRHGNSAGSSLQSSRQASGLGGRPRGGPGGAPNPNALRVGGIGLAGLPPGTKPLRPVGAQRVGSASSQHGQSPQSGSQPPTPGTSRPPSLGSAQGAANLTKLNAPPQRVKRFQPPAQGGGRPLGQQRIQSGQPPPRQFSAQQGQPLSRTPSNGGLPAINVSGPSLSGGGQLNAVQLASARAAAAARQPQRVQAISNAYGGPPALNNQQRRPGPAPPLGIRRPPGQPRPAYNVAGGSAQQLLAGQPPRQPPHREGNRGLPPAAPSARLAARLGGGPPVVPPAL